MTDVDGKLDKWDIKAFRSDFLEVKLEHFAGSQDKDGYGATGEGRITLSVPASQGGFTGKIEKVLLVESKIWVNKSGDLEQVGEMDGLFSYRPSYDDLKMFLAFIKVGDKLSIWWDRSIQWTPLRENETTYFLDSVRFIVTRDAKGYPERFPFPVAHRLSRPNGQRLVRTTSERTTAW